MRAYSIFLRWCTVLSLLLLLPLWGGRLYAQQIKNPLPAEELGVAQGLSHRQPTHLLQDKYGFLWIGTENGLNRYDGYTFTVFKHRRGDSTSLSHNWIVRLYEDKMGTLWVCTFDGLNRYNRANNTFTAFKAKPQAHEHPVNGIFNAWEDKSGNFWVFTAAGVQLFDRKKETFTALKGLECGCISSFYEDRSGTLWGPAWGNDAKHGGLYKVNGATREVEHFVHNPKESSSLPNNCVLQVTEDKAGDLWLGIPNLGLSRVADRERGIFELYDPLRLASPSGPKDVFPFLLQDQKSSLWLCGSGGGLYQFDRERKRFSYFSTETKEDREVAKRANNNHVQAFFEDQSGKLWIGTWETGVKVWDPQTSTFAHYTKDPNDPKKLNVSGSKFYQDRAGTMWVVGYPGLARIDPWAKPFRHYKHHPHDNRSLSGNDVNCFTEDAKGTIWIGTPTGLNAFNPRTEEFTRYQSDSTDPASLGNNTVRAIHIDSTGTLWAGLRFGFDKLAPERGVFTHYRLFPDEPSRHENTILTVYEDRQGTLWLMNGEGMPNHFDRSKSVFVPYKLDPKDTNGITHKDIRSIHEDKRGSIWFASRGSGVHRYNRKTGRFTRYGYDPNDPQSISHNVVHLVYEDQQENLWFGTAGGLSQWDRSRDEFINYYESDGLPSELITGILDDGKGHLWISTQTALAFFDPRTRKFRTYDQDDGVSCTNFRDGSFFRSRSGEMYFGSRENGFVVFHPDQIKHNPTPPPVFITGFKKSNQPYYFDKYLPDLPEIRVGPSDNDISFEYVALNFSHSGKNQYAYQLADYDKDWVYCGTRRETMYTNLPPGTYTFRVKASNNDGIWNEKGASLRVIIPPPYYQTWWFRTLILLALAGVGYAFYRYRISQVRREEQLKASFDKQLAEVSMMALRAQMNPHFLFNSLNSINHFIVKNRAEEASEYLTKFSRLIRLILSNSKSPTVTLAKELEALRLYIQMEQLRFGHRFDFRIDVEEDVETEYIEIPPLLIQPYVENAIWHGLLHKDGTGHLLLRLYQEDPFLYVIIQDDGVGRQKARALKSKSATQNKSMGMQITSDRVVMLNKLTDKDASVEITDMEDTMGNATGTKVVLKIPVQ
jgi:ligand-binding sensor domain-containing protein